MSNVKSVNDKTFESEVLKSNTPVLVEFGAEWCGPCHRMSPILDQFAEKNPAVKVLKLDIDDSPSITSKFGIRGVPTIILFKNGVPVANKIGLVGLSALDAFVSEKLSD
jgi:thioredoxin 1